ncbi:unnamed protein product [marine sediment metagenome]|uniref:N-acetyltransferase domain-containing protein n=1 Tax=marine sediment metagenome TaxID=412755 RepID=X0WW93_9ZZZZ
MTTIRPATEADIPRIQELYLQLHFTPPPPDAPRPSPEEYRRAFNQIYATPGYHFLVAEDSGVILGTAVLVVLPGMVHGVSPFAVVEYVVVDEARRGTGVGRKLMEYIKEKAIKAGCYKIMLTSDNRRGEAHDFYRALGYEASAHGFRLYL